MPDLATIIVCVFVIIVSLKNFLDAKKEVKDWRNKYDILLGQKKSSEVRLGKIGENLAPFTDAWPYAPEDFIFIGREIDGILINDNEIVFIEIKTGKSKLSKSQKNVRDLVKAGKVYFETFRVDDTGCVLTRV
ncbi:MAG TPA: Holliday junction resolvase-like protein [Patescibacteria group bacterium]|nr:Holliday junction resolvase-like protein [Patescibacteria group bacterium]